MPAVRTTSKVALNRCERMIHETRIRNWGGVFPVQLAIYDRLMGLGNTGVTLSLRAHNLANLRCVYWSAGEIFNRRFPVIVRIIRNPRLTGQTGQAGQAMQTDRTATNAETVLSGCMSSCMS